MNLSEDAALCRSLGRLDSFLRHGGDQTRVLAYERSHTQGSIDVTKLNDMQSMKAGSKLTMKFKKECGEPQVRITR